MDAVKSAVMPIGPAAARPRRRGSAAPRRGEHRGLRAGPGDRRRRGRRVPAARPRRVDEERRHPARRLRGRPPAGHGGGRRDRRRAGGRGGDGQALLQRGRPRAPAARERDDGADPLARGARSSGAWSASCGRSHDARWSTDRRRSVGDARDDERPAQGSLFGARRTPPARAGRDRRRAPARSPRRPSGGDARDARRRRGPAPRADAAATPRPRPTRRRARDDATSCAAGAGEDGGRRLAPGGSPRHARRGREPARPGRRSTTSCRAPGRACRAGCPRRARSAAARSSRRAGGRCRRTAAVTLD